MHRLFELRQALPDDCEFLFDTYKLTLREHVEWAWGWDEDFQRNGFWTHHPIRDFQMILVEGQRAGGLHVEVLPEQHFVRMIFLHPEFQRQGMGSLLLRQTYQQARDAGKPLYLKVIKSNPARRLYERLGFHLMDEDATTLTMCMRPRSPLLEHLAQMKSFGPITWSREDLYD